MGFFASFRREVGKRPFNTTGPTPEAAEAMEKHLHERMRTFQFLHRFSFTDVFQVFAEMRKTERASLGSVSWETFKQFAKQPAAQEVLQQPADLVEGPELEAEPVAAVADVEPLLDDLDQASVQSELFDPDDEDADLEVVGVRQLN